MKRTATKRRSKEQLNVDRIIKKELLILGDKILEVAIPRSRRRPTEKGGGRLQDEMNKRVEPDTTLTMYQMEYGKWNYPANDNTPRQYSNGKIVITDKMNALLITMREMIPDTTKIIIGQINDILLQPFKSK
jgi:hypothetical protein